LGVFGIRHFSLHRNVSIIVTIIVIGTFWRNFNLIIPAPPARCCGCRCERER
jgi:hypothetical protein